MSNIIIHKLEKHHELSKMLREGIEEKIKIKRYKINSIRKFHASIVGWQEPYYISRYEIIEDMLYINPKVHLIISQKEYFVEKLMGIDAVAIIRGNHIGMKLTIKWI